MNVPSKPFGIVLFFSLLGLSFISCSDSTPKISSVNHTFIIDMQNDGEEPLTSLSVFVQDDNNVMRLEELTLTHLKSGLVWRTKDLAFVPGKNGRNWAGYSDFIFPGDKTFPQGRYEVLLTDKAGDEAKSSFSLNIPENIIHKSQAEYTAFFENTKLAVSFNLAIYDGELNLIYSGEMTEDVSNKDAILAKFNNAYETRNVYQISGGDIVVLFPPQILQPEADNASEGDN